MRFNNESKDILGTIFLALSIIMLGYMLISPFTQMIIHIDEYFTLTVLNFPLSDLIFVTSHDVHPPAHYLILKVVTKILTLFGIEFNRIFVYKLISIIPYAIILILSATKIKKEYGYLTAGVFAFSMGVMSEFFVHYLIIRMYSWAILFVILAFIYLKDVLDKNDTKSWALLTIFSVLAAYTHYFAAIPIVCVYMALFVYLFINDKQKLKYWVISAICGMILFSPWILSLISQFSSVSEGFWIPEITLERMIGFLGFFVDSKNIEVSLLSIAILIVLIIISLKSNDIKRTDKFYILCGIIAYIGTITIGSIISIISEPILVDRYLLPSAAILWFTISFIGGKINNRNEFIITFALILILLLAGTAHMISDNEYWAENNINKEAYFNQITQDNNSIVINTAYSYRMFYLGFSNSTDMYILNHPYELYGFNLSDLHDTFDFKEISKEEIPKLIKDNEDKNIYIISKKSNTPENITIKTLIEDGSMKYSKVL